MTRLSQLIKYGWQHAGEYSKLDLSHPSRVAIFCDIIFCFFKYKMWSNQYLTAKFYSLQGEERKLKGKEFRRQGIKRDEWQKDFRKTRKFLSRYSDIKYEIGRRRYLRQKAYIKHFNTGKNLMVEYDVEISRQHYLPGSITIGDNVLIAKHSMIDYSGDVNIGNNVQITKGVTIETHQHIFHSDYTQSREKIIATPLTISEGAVIGTGAIILPSCNYIGLHARIGAGAVVTKDIPDYAVAVGVPAKIIRFQNHS